MSLHLEDHLDLHRDVTGEPRHSDRRARVPADGLAEHFDHQVREAVDDLRLIAEAVGGVHHAEHLYHALDLVEAPELAARRREQAQTDFARRFVALLDREVLAHLALEAHGLILARAVTGEEEQIADANRGDVIRHRLVARRQRDVLFLEPCFGAHADLHCVATARAPVLTRVSRPARARRESSRGWPGPRRRVESRAHVVTATRESCHTRAVSVKPPVVPVAAATLVLLRDGPSGAELLLIKRHGKSKFAAGDHVFPGGKVETHDNPDDAASWCATLDVDAASRRLGLSAAETLAHLVGVIRETFEEVGILLAYDASGQPARVDGPRFAEHRARGQQSNAAFWDMVRAEKLTLATERIVYFAHW